MNVIATVFTVAVLALSASAMGPKWHQLDGYTFQQYSRDFGKSYSADEMSTRESLFETELNLVQQHNSADASWKMGINHMSDWTSEEKQALNGYKRELGYTATPSNLATAHKPTGLDLPSFVDWRLHHPLVVTPVKNQGLCGSCWTFASTETIESHYALKYPNKLQALSEQQVASCPFGSNPTDCGGTGGCAGGTAEVAFQSVITAGGLTSEWVYPYVSVGGTNYPCQTELVKSSPKNANITSYTKLPSNDYSALMDAVANLGPMSISVDASTWHNYEEGVYDGCNQANPAIDHAVQLVGYGDDVKLGPYWLVRNSWTPAFGEDGYIRVRRVDATNPANLRCGTDTAPLDGTGCKGGPATQHVCGTCGILFDSAYPIIG